MIYEYQVLTSRTNLFIIMKKSFTIVRSWSYAAKKITISCNRYANCEVQCCSVLMLYGLSSARRNRCGFYSQLAALWCIQPYVNSSLKNALQRTVGTFIGAAFGLIVIPLFFYLFHGKYHFLQYLIISLVTRTLRFTTEMQKKKI